MTAVKYASGSRRTSNSSLNPCRDLSATGAIKARYNDQARLAINFCASRVSAKVRSNHHHDLAEMRIAANMSFRRFGLVQLEDVIDWIHELAGGDRAPDIGAHVAHLGAQLVLRTRLVGHADIGDAPIGVEVEIELAAPAAQSPDIDDAA